MTKEQIIEFFKKRREARLAEKAATTKTMDTPVMAKVDEAPEVAPAAVEEVAPAAVQEAAPVDTIPEVIPETPEPTATEPAPEESYVEPVEAPAPKKTRKSKKKKAE